MPLLIPLLLEPLELAPRNWFDELLGWIMAISRNSPTSKLLCFNVLLSSAPSLSAATSPIYERSLGGKVINWTLYPSHYKESIIIHRNNIEAKGYMLFSSRNNDILQ